ncbi:hypothetical protein KM043_002835 [Ampulex compressa]|nr:hypothetical protein KM043_002835 [Ampulex compressa]
MTDESPHAHGPWILPRLQVGSLVWEVSLTRASKLIFVKREGLVAPIRRFFAAENSHLIILRHGAKSLWQLGDPVPGGVTAERAPGKADEGASDPKVGDA